MNMSNDQIELQKFIRSPSTPERMSGTGSFGQPSSTSFSPNVGDTVVGQMAPLYQTVPDAKDAHARYTGRIPPPSPGLYTTPSESDPPNEYDLINEKQVRGGRTQHVSENVLYGDQATATQFRHAATLEKKDSRFSGSISEPVKEPGTKESACGCTLSTMFFSFFHVVGIVIGLTALVLVILLILGVLRISSPSCDCTSSECNLSTVVLCYCFKFQCLKCQQSSVLLFNVLQIEQIGLYRALWLERRWSILSQTPCTLYVTRIPSWLSPIPSVSPLFLPPFLSLLPPSSLSLSPPLPHSLSVFLHLPPPIPQTLRMYK